MGFLAPEHARAGVEVELTMPDDPAWVLGDAAQLRRALLNLLRNAREAATEAAEERAVAGEPGTPRIVVGVSCKDDRVRTVVQDNGGGIPEDEVDRIFEAFYTRKAKGTGLGLPTVHQVATEHGGSVRVASTGPEGTVFELDIPACDPPGPSVSSPNSAALADDELV